VALESLLFWTGGIVGPFCGGSGGGAFAMPRAADVDGAAAAAAFMTQSALPLRLRRRFLTTTGGAAAAAAAANKRAAAAISCLVAAESVHVAVATDAVDGATAAALMAKSALSLRLRRRFWTTRGANRCAIFFGRQCGCEDSRSFIGFRNLILVQNLDSFLSNYKLIFNRDKGFITPAAVTPRCTNFVRCKLSLML
jgi:hypothetical protein